MRGFAAGCAGAAGRHRHAGGQPVRYAAGPTRAPSWRPSRGGSAAGADEFDDPTLAGWDVVRPTDDVSVGGGRLSLAAHLHRPGGKGQQRHGAAPHAPAGDWIAETKLRLDLGEDRVRNFQQAGLIAYRSDDDFARLSSVAIWNTRQTEYGRELVAPRMAGLPSAGRSSAPRRP